MTRRGAARELAAFAARRLLVSALAMLAAVAVACVVFEVLVAHPIRLLTHGLPASSTQLSTLRSQFGVGEPVDERFWQLLENVVRLRFGYSYQFQESAGALIGQRIGPTLLLMGASAVLAFGLRVLLRRIHRRRLVIDVALALRCAPSFWLGMVLLVLFGVGAGGLPDLFPAGGMVSPQLSSGTVTLVLDVVWHLVLPCVTLALVLAAQSFTSAAATTTLGRVGAFVGATVAVEIVFSWPGLGDLSYQALQTPDIQLLEATFLTLSAVTIALAFGIDLVRHGLGRGSVATRPELDARAASRPSVGDRRRAVLRSRGGFAGTAILALVVAWTLAAPLFVHSASLGVAQANAPILHAPTLTDPLGTDESGRSVLSLVLWGGRASLLGAVIAGALAAALGTGIGLLGARGRPILARLAVALTEWFGGLGGLPLAISVAAIIGPGDVAVTIAVVLSSWAATARRLRSGPSGGLIGVCAVFALADALLATATLAFVGLGDPLQVTWGALLEHAFVSGDIATGAWWTLVPAGAAILVVALSLRLVGRAAASADAGPAVGATAARSAAPSSG